MKSAKLLCYVVATVTLSAGHLARQAQTVPSTIYNLRPLTRSTKIVTDRPLWAAFEEFAVSGNTRTVMAKGRFSRNGLGSTRIEFDEESGERSAAVVIDVRAEGFFYLLYPALNAALKAPTDYKNEQVLKWISAVGDLTEIGEDSVSGIKCKLFRTTSSDGTAVTEVCISETLQAVLQEKTQSSQGLYIWKLSDIHQEALSKDLFEPPPNYRVLSSGAGVGPSGLSPFRGRPTEDK
jgi:hypothetical protein